MIKNIKFILLALLLIVSITACANKDDEQKEIISTSKKMKEFYDEEFKKLLQINEDGDLVIEREIENGKEIKTYHKELNKITTHIIKNDGTDKTSTSPFKDRDYKDYDKWIDRLNKGVKGLIEFSSNKDDK